MKIVVTDGYALNPGDLSWNSIKALGELIVYDRTAPELVVERCLEADIVLSNKVVFDNAILSKLPALKLISVLATGYNVIDVKAAAEKNIVVCNIPGYGTDSVAQHVFALLLELTNHVGKNAATTAAGEWQRAPDYCYSVAPIMELAHKTIGIIGFGNIGKQVAVIANAFGMQILYYNRSKKKTEFGRQTDLATVFSSSDIVSLHCPLTVDNTEFVNASLLDTMKPHAILINTSRGQLINEQDLADALNNGVIKAAALDVLSQEPPAATNPLLKAANCLITPHTAWMSLEARNRIVEATVKNIEAFTANQPVNRVN